MLYFENKMCFFLALTLYQHATAKQWEEKKILKIVPNTGFHWLLCCHPNAKCHSTRITFNLFASRKFTTCTIVNNDNNIYGLNETNLFHSHIPKMLRQFWFYSELSHVHTFARTFIQSATDSINAMVLVFYIFDSVFFSSIIFYCTEWADTERWKNRQWLHRVWLCSVDKSEWY